MSFEHRMYSISTFHFFGEKAGNGFYLRGDLGIAFVSMEKEKILDDAVVWEWTYTKRSMGILAGMGYGISFSDTSRMLIGVNVVTYEYDGDRITSIGLTIGGMWG